MKISKTIISPEIYAFLKLALTPQVGPVTMRKLLHHFGSAKEILNKDSHTLGKFVNKTIVNLILNDASQERLDNTIEWLDKDKNNHILVLINDNYPRELKQISDPPPILFAKGKLELLLNPKLAVVGTRHPSPQGSINARNFSQDLSNNGITIVSGMAAGIDRAAHLGALNAQSGTIGVLGTGIDRIYPSSNSDLFHKVAEDGLLISEFPLGVHALNSNFPRRNRIVAGLSIGCLVIESAIDGGSMITANLALEMGRDVMAIPGSIHNPVARGCHKLIKQGAKLIETTNDVIEEFNLTPSPQNSNLEGTTISNSDDHILEIIGYDAMNIDKICLRLDKPFAEICAKLLELELDGQIINCGNGEYQRIFR